MPGCVKNRNVDTMIKSHFSSQNKVMARRNNKIRAVLASASWQALRMLQQLAGRWRCRRRIRSVLKALERAHLYGTLDVARLML